MQDISFELKLYALSLVLGVIAMARILENLKSVAKINKEFRGLAQDLVYNSKSPINLGRTYIERATSVQNDFFEDNADAQRLPRVIGKIIC